MTDPRKLDDLHPALPEGVTGVASGYLGTRANLDDTLVVRTLDPLEPPAFEPELRPPEIELGDRVEPGTSAIVDPQPDIEVAPAAAAPVEPIVLRRRTRSGDNWGRALAGVLAIAFVALAGLVVATTAPLGTLGADQALPSVTPSAPAETADVVQRNGKKDKKCPPGNEPNEGCRKGDKPAE